MPLAKIIRPTVSPKYKEMEDDLVKEWLHPQRDVAEPVIIEEHSQISLYDDVIRLYVIWTRWIGLDEVERSEVIASACERARGRDYVLQVTSAVGLTPEEADSAGIKYEPLETEA